MMKRHLGVLLVLAIGCSGGGGGGGGGSGGTGGSQAPPPGITKTPGTPPALTVNVTPADAQVVVRASNGQLAALPTGGARVSLPADSYSVALYKVRYASAQQQIQVDVDTVLTLSLAAETPVTPLACGVLRVSAANPHYFADNCRTRYLAGIHTWNNLIDMGVTQPPPAFDFAAFLSFLTGHNVNVTRLYAWETTHPNDSDPELRDWTAPHAWMRTGPGTASDGLPQFDLTVFDESYFVRMRERVRAMQDAGVYVMVMLFEGWSVQRSPGFGSHPFVSVNNVNGIGPASVLDIDTLTDPDITDIQEAYVRKVVDTVNDLDNVLYEIANEAVSPGSVSWQYQMIDFVRSYESAKPKQHTIGMTWPLEGDNQDLFDSPADWIAPGGVDDAVTTGAKIIVSDTDHLGGSRSGDQEWVWQRFTQGANTLLMDCYVPPDGLCGSNGYALDEEIRRALGATRSYADRMDLASAVPSPALSSSGYCLASNTELVVFTPLGGSVTVDLSGRPGTFSSEWYAPTTGTTVAGSSVAGGAPQMFAAPFGGPSVLFLWIP